MTLSEVLSGAPLKQTVPDSLASAQVTGIEIDSRKIEPGFLFFAFAGAKVDARRFAPAAMSRGAIAVVSELPPPDDFSGRWIEVAHGRRALAVAARNFYQQPDRKIHVTGITGTNGKTTTSYLFDSILRAAGCITALVGTIEYHVAGKVLPAANTTPESLDLFKLFYELEKLGGTHATMEVSSHAMSLARIYGIEFHTAVFTNLTRDHLDFHQTMEDYFRAKRLLFEGAGAEPPRFAVLNYDDAYARTIKLTDATRVLWYGIEEGAAVRARKIHASFEGLRFEIAHEHDSFVVSSGLPGRMNVYNILAASAAALSYGFSREDIQAGIANCRAVPGRFEKIEEGQPFLVAVDYAHTDDALRNVISVARALNPKRVITLFGCGGDRDRSKRPLMGSVAGELSDFAVLTSDNPRSEDPLAIINDAMVGLRRHDTPYVAEPDRGKAVRRALEEAGPGDIVILAGKGHESYQVLKDKTIPFDDREVARKILREMGYGRTEK